MGRGNRDLHIHRYGKRYICFGQIGDACVYCGDVASHMDHRPPISIADDERASVHMLVPSCAECNLLLGDKPLFTINEARSALVVLVTLRHRSLLSSYQENAYDQLLQTRVLSRIGRLALNTSQPSPIRVAKCTARRGKRKLIDHFGITYHDALIDKQTWPTEDIVLWLNRNGYATKTGLPWTFSRFMNCLHHRGKLSWKPHSLYARL